MGHSNLCSNLTTFLNNGRCVSCEKPGPGRGITPNCGYDDNGGRHEVPSKKCLVNTFNDGTGYFCQPCSPCPPGFIEENSCTPNANTKCHATKQTTTASATTQGNLSSAFNPSFDATEATRKEQWSTAVPRPGTHLLDHNPAITKLPPESWALPLTFLICTTLLLLSCLFIYRKRGLRKSPCPDAQFTAVKLHKITQLKDIISPDIVAAPLMCVLDDLDVLEELIILLDPETHGIKNTKHLASLCNFPSSWVTYTYSLKESKSPLKALLEGIACKHPEWTVGSLAELLSQMERMDAVMALSKIHPDKLDTIIDV
uniref:IGF-like family receptor 1 n=1 Tax=Neogobius melanostomus TaxID=47308 RepID=A0A8C6SK67_9GOBI